MYAVSTLCVLVYVCDDVVCIWGVCYVHLIYMFCVRCVFAVNVARMMCACFLYVSCTLSACRMYVLYVSRVRCVYAV